MNRGFSTSRWLAARDHVDTEELAVIFGYTCRWGVLHAINNDSFPVPVFKRNGRWFALRSAVRTYFEKQIEAAEQFAEQPAKVDKRLISREKREAVRERKLQALETLAQKLARKELKRKEAERRKYLKAIRTAQENADRVSRAGIRTDSKCDG